MKLGRKPAVHNRRTMMGALIMAKSLDALGTPPEVSNDYVAAVDKATGGDWGMMGNDTLGDCTFADGAHQIMLHTANCGRIFIPHETDVIGAYALATGYDPSQPSTDQGAVEVEVCDFMKDHGISGHKSSGWANVEPTNLDHIKWAVQLFGACRLGVNLPQSAMNDTAAGSPWGTGHGGAYADILGGHDVPIVKYDKDLFYIVTWGKLQAVTPAFLNEYCDEAHAEVYEDWVNDTGVAPSGFRLDALLANLSLI